MPHPQIYKKCKYFDELPCYFKDRFVDPVSNVQDVIWCNTLPLIYHRIHVTWDKSSKTWNRFSFHQNHNHLRPHVNNVWYNFHWYISIWIDIELQTHIKRYLWQIFYLEVFHFSSRLMLLFTNSPFVLQILQSIM